MAEEEEVKKPKKRAKKKKKAAAPPPAPTDEVRLPGPPEVPAVEPKPEPLEEPKIVLRDAHKIRDPRAKTRVRGKKTVLAFAANQNIQIIAGKETTVPRAAVEDLVRTGCIHRPKNA